jgi:hypothetical protein
MTKRTIGRIDDVRSFLDEIFVGDMHAKRIESLANGTLGILNSASLAVQAIGLGLAHARGLVTKHAVKQVDRLVGNAGVEVWECFTHWVPHLIAERASIMVALDWTDFDADGHAMIALNLLTSHGRATPLIWKTVKKSALKDHRNDYEDEVLNRLYDVLPAGVTVTVIADRGFGDTKLFAYLCNELGFNYLIRLKKNIVVTSAQGEIRKTADWVASNGRAKTLRNAQITAEKFAVPTVVCVKAKAMKEAWCLASSDAQALAAELINYYGKRWGIETYFRDTKDPRFGMGMKSTRTQSTARRDRLFLLSAFAIVLLTLLGAAGERVGYDRLLKANTVKHRTHSLFRQGWMIYELLPTMPEKWIALIMPKYSEMLREQRAWSAMLGYV